MLVWPRTLPSIIAQNPPDDPPVFIRLKDARLYEATNKPKTPLKQGYKITTFIHVFVNLAPIVFSSFGFVVVIDVLHAFSRNALFYCHDHYSLCYQPAVVSSAVLIRDDSFLLYFCCWDANNMTTTHHHRRYSYQCSNYW